LKRLAEFCFTIESGRREIGATARSRLPPATKSERPKSSVSRRHKCHASHWNYEFFFVSDTPLVAAILTLVNDALE
jgi:hypothetical protein